MERFMLDIENQNTVTVINSGTVTKYDTGILPDGGLGAIIEAPWRTEIPKRPIKVFQGNLGIKILYLTFNGTVLYDALSQPASDFQEAGINPYDLINQLPKA